MPANHGRGGGIRIAYQHIAPGTDLPAGLLAAVHFGGTDHPSSTALTVHVQLDPVHGEPLSELWYATGAVQHGTQGAIRYASDADHLFGVIELDERDQPDIAAAAATAYAAIADFQRESPFPHLLRMWNYFDAINEGEGDGERYRQFCVGRALGLSNALAAGFPAATAIGHQRATGRLQIFWLASRTAGRAVENPRQLSAYRYPRLHGPVSPSFARAMSSSDGALLISGTASIVGHSSLHDDDAIAQLEETLRNLVALRVLTHAAARHSLLKVYVRDPQQAELIAARLHSILPAEFAGSDILYLAADICRSELLLEIEGVQFSLPGT